MNGTPEFDPSQYSWQPQPQAARYIDERIEQATSGNPWLLSFAGRLLQETGTRLVDWLDHIVVESDAGLANLGYQQEEQQSTWGHRGGLFPKIVVAPDQPHPLPLLAMKVESVDAFIATHANDITSSKHAGAGAFRMALLNFDGAEQLRIVERHGYAGFRSGQPEDAAAIAIVLDRFRNRARPYEPQIDGFQTATSQFDQAAESVGRDRACDLFFQAEREFWQSRNRAAKIQYERQNRLGLGWANHDHHTYRCSREGFAPLIAFLERTGFECRERFYAGPDAGWGAQVLEHHACGIVIFADVDMSPEELQGDFAHQGLEPIDDLGTVGLWCKLHGDSFLAAGMHHLECQFEFDAARQQLAVEGIETMAPFTDFPHLKQAFTKGEVWRVPESRLNSLVTAGAISREEADRFAADGAIGSHLEILERNDGYKGFNQTGVSKIILETNPKHATS